MSAPVPDRRRDDPPEMGFLEERAVRRDNSKINKLVISVLVTIVLGLVSVVSWGFVRDRGSIDDDIKVNKDQIERTNERVNAMQSAQDAKNAAQDAQILVMQSLVGDVNRRLEAQDQVLKEILRETKKRN